ncbi:NitT/TauT family transport system permease protein [Catenulispora sp. MAP5-51]|uniref:ABC transporter permease n=1 Tax=Catenulispora sp. MAP5-51 TaxID=3156298 RepID=UPI0035142AD8
MSEESTKAGSVAEAAGPEVDGVELDGPVADGAVASAEVGVGVEVEAEAGPGAVGESGEPEVVEAAQEADGGPELSAGDEPAADPDPDPEPELEAEADAAEPEAAEVPEPGAPDSEAPDALQEVEAGLDALETAQPTAVHETGRLVAVLRAAYPPILAIVLIIAVWQILYAAKIWPDWKLPGPSETFSSLKSTFSSGDALPSVGHSVEHGAIGFCASVVIGTPLGLLVGRLRPVRAGLGPILSGLQSLPSVAWVPPALMFFGPKPAMLYAVVLAGAVPSIAVGVVSGLDQVPPLYLRVGRNLGARGLSSVRYVLLPAALPGYLAGLRQGWAFSWRSLLAAEIIVESADLGHSLGFLLKNAQDSNDMAGAFAAIVLILAVGVAVNQLLFVPLERRVLRSRGLT